MVGRGEDLGEREKGKGEREDGGIASGETARTLTEQAAGKLDVSIDHKPESIE
jgi:hypothetical protein